MAGCICIAVLTVGVWTAGAVEAAAVSAGGVPLHARGHAEAADLIAAAVDLQLYQH